MGISIRGTQTVADGSITTAKLADNAVTPAKVTQDIVTQHFVGTEIPLTSNVQAETSLGQFAFNINSDVNEQWKSFGYSAFVLSSDVGNTVTLKVYIDNTHYGTDQTTTSTSGVVVKNTGIDISSLTVGNHTLELRMTNSSASQSGTVSLWDIYFGKK